MEESTMRSRISWALVSLALIVGACGGAAAPTPSSPGSPAIDLNAKTVGPNGEPSTPVEQIPDLSADELAQVKAAGYTAALLWAGAGTWYNALTSGAEEEFGRLGIDIVARAEANFDPARQQTDVETAMARRPSIILTLPVDPTAAAQAFRPAVNAGVKLVFVDNGIDGYTAGKEYVAIVTGDHFEMGKAAAKLMSDALGGKGKIGYIFHDAVYYVTNNRDRYFKAAIEQLYPDIEIVAEQGFTEEGKTQEIAAAMLTQHPDLNGIYVAWSAAAQGVIAALREAGRKDVKVVSYDLDAVNDLDMARCGNMYGVALDQPYLEGKVMARIAALALLGKSVPPFITVPVQTETRETIAQVWKENVNADPPQEILDALAGPCPS
jgi:ribose transport system substrate-binding protein